jgi:GTPase SAR1 family protein
MKIGLCGTMSVGKTTLVNALKELQSNLKVINLQQNAVNI